VAEPVPETEEITLQQAADRLGVHYMTAYRYVRLGRLPARKDGGVWKVAVADLDLLAAAGPTPVGRRGRGPGSTAHPGADWAARFEARLVAGDSRGATGVVEAALAAGAGLDDLYLGVVGPAMHHIGDRWATGELDVADEHRATSVAHEVLGRVADRFARPGRTRGNVVVGAAPGERHGLAVTMVAHLLRADGWEVDDLGADVPAPSFGVAARSVARLVAVGISVTHAENLEGARAAVVAVRDAVGDVPVLLGGAAVAGAAEAAALGADGWAPDGRAAAEVLAAIATRAS
jgi:excisionase family DNA binding protein